MPYSRDWVGDQPAGSKLYPNGLVTAVWHHWWCQYNHLWPRYKGCNSTANPVKVGMISKHNMLHKLPASSFPKQEAQPTKRTKILKQIKGQSHYRNLRQNLRRGTSALHLNEPAGGSCCGAGLGLVWHCYFPDIRLFDEEKMICCWTRLCRIQKLAKC